MWWLIKGVSAAVAALALGVVSLRAKGRFERSVTFFIGLFFLVASITFLTG